MKPQLEIKNLTVQVGGKDIIRDVNLVLAPGEIHALMGPNGSGKSTLAFALMGHPRYVITKGMIILNGIDVTHMPAHKRARQGLFLSQQHPKEIEGVSVINFLRTAINSHQEQSLSILEANKLIEQTAQRIGIKKEFLSRSINKGFSGGEKKRMEILQLLLLKPKVAILDETDSGLDVDALKVVSEGMLTFCADGTRSVLVITHYRRILEYLKPNKVSIMRDGRIVKTGGPQLINEIEKKGFGTLRVL